MKVWLDDRSRTWLVVGDGDGFRSGASSVRADASESAEQIASSDRRR
jgi:hypothetical protein